MLTKRNGGDFFEQRAYGQGVSMDLALPDLRDNYDRRSLLGKRDRARREAAETGVPEKAPPTTPFRATHHHPFIGYVERQGDWVRGVCDGWSILEQSYMATDPAGWKALLG